MISSEVQRTLVKSPPELWAELSDPDALARHLGELGEIRITRAEPEKRVEWEADGTSGSVLIKPSGWGTKVTLSVKREIETSPHRAAEIERATSVAEAEAEAEPVSEVAEPPEADAEIVPADAAPAAEIIEPGVIEPEPEAPTFEAEAAGLSAEVEGSEAAESPTPAEPVLQPAPRRGFFARLFGRRQPRTPEPVVTPIPPVEQPATGEVTITEPVRNSSAIESLQARFQAEPSVEADPEPEAAPEPGAASAEQATTPADEADKPSRGSQESASEPPGDLAAELKAAEEVAAEEVTAVLTAVLDRLGAAHHRPFSRA